MKKKWPDWIEYPLLQLKNWVINHLRASLFGVGELVRTPLSSLFTLLVIGIAATFPATLYALLANFQPLTQDWHGTPTISLYLKPDLSRNATDFLMTQLKKRPDIKEIRYISPEQGLQDFKHQAPFTDAFKTLDTNPLPGVIVVTPNIEKQTPEELNHLLNDLQQLKDIDIGQLDMAWLMRLYYWIELGKRITYSLALLFSIGVILIISNTIRLTTEQHHQDIMVLKLIGATDSFIRRPLLYRGLLYGILGGLIAWGFVILITAWIKYPVQILSQSYQQNFSLHSLSFPAGLTFLLICALLGLIGSWLPARQYLLRSEKI